MNAENSEELTKLGILPQEELALMKGKNIPLRLGCFDALLPERTNHLPVILKLPRGRTFLHLPAIVSDCPVGHLLVFYPGVLGHGTNNFGILTKQEASDLTGQYDPSKPEGSNILRMYWTKSIDHGVYCRQFRGSSSFGYGTEIQFFRVRPRGRNPERPKKQSLKNTFPWEFKREINL